VSALRRKMAAYQSQRPLFSLAGWCSPANGPVENLAPPSGDAQRQEQATPLKRRAEFPGLRLDA